MPLHYHCHLCNLIIRTDAAITSCPLCHESFIEELSIPQRSSAAQQAPVPARRATSESNASNLASTSRGNQSTDASVGALRMIPGPGATITVISGGNAPMRVLGSQSSRRSNSSQGEASFPLQLLQMLNMNANRLPLLFTGGGPWDREGLDAIVTRLMDQMADEGPPPLEREQIDGLPKVQVTAEDVKNNAQCSVCWEDFKLGEDVRKLPCAHIFHDGCIVPWLELHNTCPICRMTLGSDANANTESSGPSSSRQNTQ